MADVLLEDPQLVALPLGHVRNNGLNGVADRVEAQLAPAPLPCCSTGDGGDGLPQGLSGGGVHEPVGLAQVVTADDGGEGGVAVPLGTVLVDDVGAAVEGDQVAVGQDPLTGDAVDDLVVDGDAHGGRVVVVAQEVGVGTGGLDDPGRDSVELGGGDAGAHRLAQGGVDVGDDEPGPAHEANLPGRLDLDLFA